MTIHLLHEAVIIGSGWMMPILLLALTVLPRLIWLFDVAGHILLIERYSRTRVCGFQYYFA